MASSVGMDKSVMKVLFGTRGLPVAAFETVSRHEWMAGRAAVLRRVTGLFAFPVFVKPANLGSSVGISKAANQAELEASLADLLQSTNRALDPHEQMACLVAMTEAWTVDNELITPTLKVKRNRIEDLFAADFERWTRMGREIVWHEK
jgi:biotin carboxylase